MAAWWGAAWGSTSWGSGSWGSGSWGGPDSRDWARRGEGKGCTGTASQDAGAAVSAKGGAGTASQDAGAAVSAKGGAGTASQDAGAAVSGKGGTGKKHIKFEGKMQKLIHKFPQQIAQLLMRPPGCSHAGEDLPEEHFEPLLAQALCNAIEYSDLWERCCAADAKTEKERKPESWFGAVPARVGTASTTNVTTTANMMTTPSMPDPEGKVSWYRDLGNWSYCVLLRLLQLTAQFTGGKHQIKWWPKLAPHNYLVRGGDIIECVLGQYLEPRSSAEWEHDLWEVTMKTKEGAAVCRLIACAMLLEDIEQSAEMLATDPKQCAEEIFHEGVKEHLEAISWWSGTDGPDPARPRSHKAWLRNKARSDARAKARPRGGKAVMSKGKSKGMKAGTASQDAGAAPVKKELTPSEFEEAVDWDV